MKSKAPTFSKILWVIFLISIAATGVNRAQILMASTMEPAQVVSCGSKWVKVRQGSSPQYKDQVQYYPQAKTESGVMASGSISVLTRNLCSQMLGSEVRVLIPNDVSSEPRFYSFVQFWGIAVFVNGAILMIMISLYSAWLVRFYVVLWVASMAWFGGKELGVFTYYFPELMTGKNVSSSQAALDRCVWAQMYKDQLIERKDVTSLNCLDQKISDLSSIADLVNLEELYLQGNHLVNLKGLEPFINLKKLSVAGMTTLTTTQGIGQLINLEELQANKSQIKYLVGVENLSQLKVIAMMMNQIDDISALRELKNLKEVNFNYNQISNISALADKPELEKLSLYSNPISDVSALFDNKKLMSVGLDGTVTCRQFKDLQFQLLSEAKVYVPEKCE